MSGFLHYKKKRLQTCLKTQKCRLSMRKTSDEFQSENVILSTFPVALRVTRAGGSGSAEPRETVRCCPAGVTDTPH